MDDISQKSSLSRSVRKDRPKPNTSNLHLLNSNSNSDPYHSQNPLPTNPILPQPISMQMNMNWTPVTDELEKLRLYMSDLISSLMTQHQEQMESLKKGPFQSSRSQHRDRDHRDDLARVLDSFKSLLLDENREVKKQLREQTQRANDVEASNSFLQSENTRLKQQVHECKSDVNQLQVKFAEVQESMGRDSIRKI